VARTGLAEVLKERGQLGEAERLYRETMAGFPEDVVVRSGLAEVLKARGQLGEAERLYRETVAGFPEDVVPRNGLAEVLKERGQLEEAERLYRETMAGFPGNVVVRNGLAEVLKARGQLEEAERLYRETVAGFPGNMVARSGLAGVLASAGNVGNALDLLPMIREPSARGDWIVSHMRAMILLRTGDRREALPLLRRGWETCPLPSQRDYYRSALAFDAIRHGDYAAADDLLREPSPFAKNERVLDIARLHLAAARGAESARPEAVRLLSEPGTTTPMRGVIRLIDIRFGLDSGPAPASEHTRLDAEIFGAEIELARAA